MSTILVIEDDPDIQQLIHLSLEFTGGYQVLLASDGPEGLVKAAEGKPDLILLDAMMPGMDGFEVCRSLKSNPETETIPVVFLTAKAQASEIQEGLRLGAAGYLTKPFDPMKLKDEIERYLPGGE
ncbi:MAG: response regulator [Armatimonadetes bacterium]|nr:response regulator [Armatimonadota bacterium]